MKTIFLRTLEAEDKVAALRDAIRNPESATGRRRFEVDPATFAAVPRSPFAYWVSERIRDLFSERPAFEGEGRTATIGLSTKDDFRYMRHFWEVVPENIASNRISTTEKHWVLMVKGGKYSPFYRDVSMVVLWHKDGYQLKTDITEYRGSRGWGYLWSAAINGHSHYFDPGLTWPLRGYRFSAQPVPGGCIFSVAGKMAFFSTSGPIEWLGIFNSGIFDRLIALFAGSYGGVQYEAGLIQKVPVPSLTDRDRKFLSQKAHRAWSLSRSLDSCVENSHAFTLPSLLQIETLPLANRATAWTDRVRFFEDELAVMQAEIDRKCFDLYGIGDEDRRTIAEGLGESSLATAISFAEGEGEPRDDEIAVEGEEYKSDAAGLAAELLSWAVGVAFGRFDLRLATGERSVPPVPEPFDPLPVCSPGMLTSADGLPVVEPPLGYRIVFPHDGILVDDEGHDRDLIGYVQQVFRVIFGEDADARLQETSGLFDPRDRDPRAWLARSYFDEHLKRYSKSRRRAPIFWQLATPSASYSVWVYCHRATRDTFFHVLNDHVDPKLRHEEEKFTRIQQEAGPNPSAGQRRALAEQESFVEELRGLRQEVARVAPLWNPDLNDGVIINFSLLWRLIPHHRAWQRECRECWDKLVTGNYDWAHLAMHLWPERVVPKCADDRSLAIAHGLEDEFWEEADGKWRKRQVPSARVNELVKERTSPAVKTALVDLLESPATGSVSSRGRIPRRAAATQRPEPAQPKRPTIEGSPKDAPARRTEPAPLDETILAKVRDAIAQVASGASKSDVLTATGLSDTEWHRAVSALVDNGEVNRTGEKRGTRYHIADRKKG
jgi:hypothetical protein